MKKGKGLKEKREEGGIDKGEAKARWQGAPFRPMEPKALELGLKAQLQLDHVDGMIWSLGLVIHAWEMSISDRRLSS